MKIRQFLFTAIFLATAMPCVCGAWSDLESTARRHLINLVAIDTSQSTGKELDAARYIYKELNNHNIDWDIYQPERGRASISAVIKGSDKNAPPLMLLTHLDTVSVTPSWTRPPFKAIFEDGKIYGLGTTDDKNYTAIYLAFITWIKENNIKPKRDIIFLATADEEAGSAKGLKWLINTPAWADLKPGYALNEGGTVIIDPQSPAVVFVEAATKMYMDIKITAYGAGGHSSSDQKNNAVYNLSQALSKIEKMRLPYHIDSFTKNFFKAISAVQDEDAKTTIEILLGPSAADSIMAADIVAEDPFFKTQLADTISPVIISSGSDSGATLDEASAILNCRLLPSTNPEAFVDRIKKLFEKDENIFIEVVEYPKENFPQPEGGKDALYASIKRAAGEMFEGSVTLLGMTPASSDSEFLRRAGVVTYGIGAPSEASGTAGRSHASDEHISEDSFYQQLRFFSKIVYDFAVASGNIEDNFK